jgi:hypothetical protein
MKGTTELGALIGVHPTTLVTAWRRGYIPGQKVGQSLIIDNESPQYLAWLKGEIKSTRGRKRGQTKKEIGKKV